VTAQGSKLGRFVAAGCDVRTARHNEAQRDQSKSELHHTPPLLSSTEAAEKTPYGVVGGAPPFTYKHRAYAS
jgi:hypothetical protein